MKKMYDIIIAIILALGAIISVAIFSNTIDKINRKNNIITVKTTTSIDKNIKEYYFYLDIKSFASELEKSYDILYDKEDKVLKDIKYKYSKENEEVKSVINEKTSDITSYIVETKYIFKSSNYDEIKNIRLDIQKSAIQIKNAEVSEIESIYDNVDENKLLSKAMKESKDKAYEIVKSASKNIYDVVKIHQEKINDSEKKASVTLVVTYEIN